MEKVRAEEELLKKGISKSLINRFKKEIIRDQEKELFEILDIDFELDFELLKLELPELEELEIDLEPLNFDTH